MFNSSLVKKTLLFVILAELLSLFGWLLPQFNMVAFFVILFLTLILSLKKLEYGIYILLAELFIASEGYLFSFEFGETLVSIRIGLFLVVMGVWGAKVILRTPTSIALSEDDVKSRGDHVALREGSRGSSNNMLNRISSIFHGIPRPVMLTGLGMTTVLVWAFLWGIIRGNDFGNVFLDFNNWLYFLLVLPIMSVCQGRDAPWRVSTPENDVVANFITILVTCVAWVGIKSLILLYIFSHQFVWALPEVYKWVRDTRVGEVTLAGGGFYRVFLQSQIFSLLTFFILLSISNFQFLISKQISNFKLQISKYLLLIICLTTLILSFSRSYWVGLAAGLFLYYFIFIFLKKARFLDIFKSFAKILLIGIVSLGIVFLVINLPPRVAEGDLASLLGKRATELGGAGASRINQLKPLGLAIAKHPVIGSGFGTTLTYITNDPRVVPETAGHTGEFTTYAFEWGYLDMVLKFGLFGLVVYLILIFSILRRLLNPKSKILNPKQIQNSNSKIQNNETIKQWNNNYQLSIINYQLRFGFALALIALLVVNIFSPYLNHPLGIGFIIISSFFVYRTQKNTD